MKKEQRGVRDLVTPKALLQELLLARVCHASVCEGRAPGRGDTQWVRSVPQSQTSHAVGKFEDVYYMGGHKLLIFGSILSLRGLTNKHLLLEYYHCTF